MNVLVIGCGRMGSSLCAELENEGHVVSVIDNDSKNFDLLPDNFSGFSVAGVPIDQDVLRRAGIEGCDAVAAVTPDDNMNVMVCQIATELFHVPRVLARIYDPRRGEVFNRLGVRTVCPTDLAANAVLAMLHEQQDTNILYLDAATISFQEQVPQAHQIGQTLGTLMRENDGVRGLFGLLTPDGNVTLAHPGSNVPVTPENRLLFVKVVD